MSEPNSQGQIIWNGWLANLGENRNFDSPSHSFAPMVITWFVVLHVQGNCQLSSLKQRGSSYYFCPLTYFHMGKYRYLPLSQCGTFPRWHVPTDNIYYGILSPRTLLTGGFCPPRSPSVNYVPLYLHNHYRFKAIMPVLWILDPTCNRYSDLIGWARVPIPHKKKNLESSINYTLSKKKKKI